MPPTLTMLGDADRLIPVETARRFHGALDRLEVPNKLVVYPGQGHGFFNYRPGGNKSYRQTLAAADDFLVGLGWIEPADD